MKRMKTKQVRRLEILLNNVIKKVPYNSFSTFLDYYGFQTPQELGGSCITQNKVLSYYLKTANFAFEFVSFIEDNLRHYATIVKTDNDFYYIDPFIMQTEPLSLSNALLNEVECEVNAYPKFNDLWSKIILKPSTQTRFVIELYGLIKNKYTLIHRYKYDLNNTLKTLPYDNSKKFLIKKKKLSIRFFIKNDEVSTIGVNPETGVLSIKTIGSNKKTFNFDKSPRQFKNALKRICLASGLHQGVVLKNLYLGYLSYLNYFLIKG